MMGLQVVGMGSCCVDYLASVAAFPRPDEKLRSETLEVRACVNYKHCVCLGGGDVMMCHYCCIPLPVLCFHLLHCVHVGL